MGNFNRFVLPLNTNPDEIQDILSDYKFSLESMDYRSADLFVRAYSKGSKNIHFVTDESVDRSYIAFNAAFKNDEIIFQDMNVLRFDEAIKIAKKMSQAKDIYFATMSSSRAFNENVLKCLEAAVNHVNSDFRRHAYLSMLYITGKDWSKEMTTLLLRAISSESNSELKEIANKVLVALEHNQWNES